MRLEPVTIQLLQECFEDQKCCRCARPAVRLARKRFYCDHHFPLHRTDAEVARRVYKHPRFSGRN
jgi:hypothetical protein